MRDFIKKRLLIFCFILVVTLIFLEVGAQIFFRITHGRWLWETDSFRVHYTRPAPPPRDYTLTPGYNDGLITIDSMGLRRLGVRTCRGPVIVCLGDSVPFGAGVRDDQTYPAQLQYLANTSGCCVQVINAGVPSYTIAQSFARLWEELYGRIKISLVILQAANDVSLLSYYRSKYYPGITWAALRFSSEWSDGIVKYFAITEYLGRIFRIFRERKGYDSVDPAPMLRYVRHTLEINLQRCIEHGWRVILLPVVLRDLSEDGMLRRAFFGKYVRSWDKIITSLNGLLEEEAYKYQGVFFVDLRPVLRSASRKAPVFADIIHYTPWGNKVIAKYLWKFFVREGLGKDWGCSKIREEESPCYSQRGLSPN